MRILLLLMLASGLAIAPFVMLRQPWAMTIWRRIRLVIVIYAIVILVSALVTLVFRWDQIYG